MSSAVPESTVNEISELARFLRRGALMLPVLLIPPIVNFTVDPGNVFASYGSAERKIAQAGLAGQYVANFQFYSHRTIQKTFIESLRVKPDVLVIGSSRSLFIGPTVLPRVKLANVSILGGTLEDCLAMYDIARRAGKLGRVVILNVDPWMFNGSGVDPRSRTIAPELRTALADFQISSWPKNGALAETDSRLSALFSISYFQQSLLMFREDRERPKWKIVPAGDNSELVRRPDGSYIATRDERLAGPAAAEAKAETYIEKDPIYMLDGFSRTDPQYRAALERLVRQMKSDGVSPVILLVPYHPIVFHRVTTDPKYSGVTEAESWVRKLGAAEGISVVGSYDPSRLGYSSADFYDGHHVREYRLRQLLEGVVKVPQ